MAMDAAVSEVDAIDSPRRIGSRLKFSRWSKDVFKNGIGVRPTILLAIENYEKGETKISKVRLLYELV